MLCKKCKTSVNDTDEMCSYCGAKIGRGRYLRLGIIVSIPIVFLLVNFYFMKSDNSGFASEAYEPTALETKEPEPTNGPLPEDMDDEESAEPAEPTDPAQPSEPTKSAEQAQPTKPPALDPYEITSDAAKAVAELYERFEVYSVYVSNKGYLYEYSSQNFITMDDLFEMTELNQEYRGEDVLILYLRPSDMARFSQLTVTSRNLLEIYTAYETMEGFVIYSPEGYTGILHREDMQQLLQEYEYEHGQVKQVTYNSSDYEEMSYAIGAQYNGPYSFDYRYLFMDDKYALAVVSPKDDTTDLSMFVLENANNMWFIVLQDIENASKHRQYINEQIPDFNLEIAPDYNLSSFMPYLQADYSDVVRSMKLNMQITEEDEPLIYASGVSDFCCLEFDSGRRFVGSLETDGLWYVEEIRHYADGVMFLNQKSNRPPLFILKQYD